MDPITHAIAGLAVATLSGDPLTLTGPVYLSSMLGAMAPDLDIVFQFKGDMAYLKQHRGSSHGLLGLAFFSVGIAILLHLLFPAAAFAQLLLWSFLGGVSHTLLDVLNSYGARFLEPFSKGNFSLNLLTIFDPIVVLLLGAIVFGIGLPGWLGIFVYLLLRLASKKLVHAYLQKEFPTNDHIIIMPAMTRNFAWSFLVDTGDLMFTGEIPFFQSEYTIRRQLKKHRDSQLIKLALQTPLGRLFSSFTPYFYVDLQYHQGNHVVRFFDLRYYTRKKFLHSATAVFDQNMQLLDSVFQPYNEKRRISVG
ncbi:metal-dependent hydrolase [Metallumcola ferriviriculae]|uniref:Metal-dependent hydrolase n=1 Tax=Metallumcola ferriviriculae TaxID=3039180 RepID=A0AAU0UNJ4_9FIRM|nr:metal-dependent hydrolase [Desulfitibacteraceae bacterium MK1]